MYCLLTETRKVLHSGTPACSKTYINVMPISRQTIVNTKKENTDANQNAQTELHENYHNNANKITANFTY